MRGGLQVRDTEATQGFIRRVPGDDEEDQGIQDLPR